MLPFEKNDNVIKFLLTSISTPAWSLKVLQPHVVIFHGFPKSETKKVYFNKIPSMGGFIFFPCVFLCLQEDEMHLQTALRLISIIGYSLSLSSLMVATLVMGMLRSASFYCCLYLYCLCNVGVQWSAHHLKSWRVERWEGAVWGGRTHLAWLA